MAEVLVLVEQDAEGALKKVTNELITAARALGTPSAVVVGAPGGADGIIEKDRCIVDQNIDRPFQRLGRKSGKRAGLCGIGQVGLQRDRAAAQGRQRCGKGSRFGHRGAGMDGDIEAVGGKVGNDGAADPPGAARHKNGGSFLFVVVFGQGQPRKGR